MFALLARIGDFFLIVAHLHPINSDFWVLVGPPTANLSVKQGQLSVDRRYCTIPSVVNKLSSVVKQWCRNWLGHKTR
jgi:hypothetical protein